jgi:hypothetical protein
MKYEFHPEAEQELYVAASCYESEVSGPGFRSLSCTRVYQMSFTLSPSLREAANPAIGARASKTADKLFQPTCAPLAAQR